MRYFLIRLALLSLTITLLRDPGVAAQEVTTPPTIPQPNPTAETAVTDQDYVDVATDAVELLATFDSASAEPKFRRLQTMMTGPAKASLMDSLLTGELPVIQSTRRVQKFILNKEKTAIEHFPDLNDTVVRLSGTRSQWIELKPQPPEELTYHVNLEAEPAESGKKPRIFVKDIKVRAASETYSFPGHISNKTRWMNEFEQKSAEKSGALESQQTEIQDLIAKLSIRVEELSKKLKAAEAQLNAVTSRLDSLERSSKDNLRKQTSAELKRKLSAEPDDSFADDE